MYNNTTNIIISSSSSSLAYSNITRATETF